MASKKNPNPNPFMPVPEEETPFGGTPTPGPAPMPGNMSGNMNDSFEVDLSDVQESSYSIPDGTYYAKCINVEQDVSKSGNPMFVWEFEISRGNYRGRTFKSWTAITPAAMWKVAETVQALGVGQTGTVVKFKRGDVIGRECGLVMEEDEYNGKTSSKIVKVVPVSEVGDAD